MPRRKKTFEKREKKKQHVEEKATGPNTKREQKLQTHAKDAVLKKIRRKEKSVAQQPTRKTGDGGHKEKRHPKGWHRDTQAIAD